MSEVINSELRTLENFLESLTANGEKIPKRLNSSEPHFRAISAATGIPYKFILSQSFRQRISLAVSQIGLAPNEDSECMRLKNQFEKNRALLNNYFEWLKNQGEKLPENPQRRGETFYAQVEVEAKLSQDALRFKNINSDETYTARLARKIKNMAGRLGMEVRVLPQIHLQKVLAITYQYLLDKGTEEREHGLKGKHSARQQKYNTRWALNKLRNSCSLKKNSLIGSELVVDFKATIEKVMAEIGSERTRKKFQTEIYWWHDFYKRLIKNRSIPEDFHEAIVYLIDRSGLTLPVLSKLINITTGGLRKWYLREATPSTMSLASLTRMEMLFKLPTGILSHKILNKRADRRFRLSDFPEFLRQNKSRAHNISKHLPGNFCTLSEEEQREIVETISNTIVRSDDMHTLKSMELRLLPYQLKQWPDQLQQEFDELAEFKMAPRPPLGMRRRGRWRVTTKDKVWDDLSYLFGALRLSDNANDVRVRGLSINEQYLTLAFIACPYLIDWYVRFRCGIRNQYTDNIINLIRSLMSLLMPRTGWLRQRPELASRLRPITLDGQEIVSRTLIKRAGKDWVRVCDEAIEYYVGLIEEIQPQVTVAKDPFLRIEGIVEMDNPMRFLETLMLGLENDMPNQYTQPIYYHVAVRDRVLIFLIGLTGLRRSTIVQLDQTGDKTSHLFRDGSKYVLRVPRTFFKVENSPYFGTKNSMKDYYMELPDVYGLHKLLDEYIEKSRPLLLKRYHPNSQEQPLFVASVKSTAVRMKPEGVTKIYTEATAKHLVENRWRGTGIAKVRRHGPQSSRHIRGTAAYKENFSYQDAADANHNSVEMAKKHYARLSPEERNKRINNILFGEK